METIGICIYIIGTYAIIKLSRELINRGHSQQNKTDAT